MIELTVGGVALVPIIVGICQLAKGAGLDLKYVPFLNAGLSVLGYALVVLVTQKPEALTPVVLALNFMIVFLSAAGFYSTVKFAVQGYQARKLETGQQPEYDQSIQPK